MDTKWGGMAVAVATFRRADSLRIVLDSIGRQTVAPSAVIVVDNSPDDPAATDIVGDYATRLQVTYLPMATNVGPAGAFAAAAEHLGRNGYEWMMCRGDDNPLPLELVEQLWKFSQRIEHLSPVAIGTIGSRWSASRARPIRVPDDDLSQSIVAVDYINGAGVPTYRVDKLADLGINFDQNLFFGFEELDLGLRLRGAGQLLLIDGETGLEQRRLAGRLGLTSSHSPERAVSVWRTYFRHRNRIIVGMRHGAKRGVAVLVARSTGKVVQLTMRRQYHEAATVMAAVSDGVRAAAPRRHYVPR